MKIIKHVKFFTSILITFLIMSVTLAGLWFSLPKLPLLQGVLFSKAIYSADQQLLRLTLNKDQNYQSFVPLNQISPLVIKATLLQEDRYFYHHLGFNPFAVIRAFVATYIMHDRRYGASTITMQVARMRYDINSKTIAGKLKQLYYSLALEKYYSKYEILQAYFNLAPYGGNIQGIKAASLIYFNTAPNKLTLAQALALVVIPQNPVKRMPKSHYNNLHLIEARNRLFTLWQQHYPVSEADRVSIALPLQISTRWHLPFLAPHFVNYVLEHHPKNPNVITSLSLPLQQLLERVTRNYILQKNKLGIENTAMLLVDTHTMQIKAMLGSADFYNQKILGQVNGVLAKRSPGSTLKPFIYALAIEQGLITPMTVIKDAPLRFHNYTPENIDDRFLGPVTAQQALLLSRNIPAVYLENQLRRENLYTLLKRAGITKLKSSNYYGLSLVLGGGELSMLELVKLYAALANQGILQNFHYLKTTHSQGGIRILTPEASFITLDMLSQNPPIGLLPTIGWDNRLPQVAWKTGTSSAFRDAWSIGIFSHYVIAVWIGNFTPKTNLAVTGYTAAAPLMFQLINAINEFSHLPSSKIMPTANLNIKKIDVCEASGLLPGKYCTKTITTWFIPGVSSIKKDRIYQRIAIDAKTGLRTCHITADTEFKVYEFWPSDLHQLFQAAGIKRNFAPEFLPNCNAADSNDDQNSLTITSPINHGVYQISSKTHQLPLTVISKNSANTIYWFVDKSYLATTRLNQIAYWHMQPGNHTITAMDQQGDIVNSSINVKSDILAKH